MLITPSGDISTRQYAKATCTKTSLLNCMGSSLTTFKYSLQHEQHQINMTDELTAEVRDAVSTFNISTRGAVNFTSENPWASIEEALDNPWSHENPEGTIVMRLAENSLMHDEVSELIHHNTSVERIHHLTYGRGPRGSPRLRKAVAALLNSDFGARERVTYDQVIVMSGVTAITDALVWSICNEGDGILVPRPFYTGYHLDISQRSRGVVIPVPFQGIEGYESFDDAFDSPAVVRRAFTSTLESTTRDGVRVKAVLLTKCAPPPPPPPPLSLLLVVHGRFPGRN